MIQRIQTVYLLIAEILTGILFFVPFAEIAGKGAAIFRFDRKGIYPEGAQNPEIIYSSLPVVILWAMSLIIIFLTIFIYKNRMLQMRLSLIGIFIQLGLEGLIFYSVATAATKLEGFYSITNYMVIPVISTILIYMAYRAIKNDELLVRSIDRIR